MPWFHHEHSMADCGVWRDQNHRARLRQSLQEWLGRVSVQLKDRARKGIHGRGGPALLRDVERVSEGLQSKGGDVVEAEGFEARQRHVLELVVLHAPLRQVCDHGHEVRLGDQDARKRALHSGLKQTEARVEAIS